MDSEEQPVAAALASAELYIHKIKSGVCRVHGGGFAGVIMCVIPCEHEARFTEYMEAQLEKGCVYHVRIRRDGAIHLEPLFH